MGTRRTPDTLQLIVLATLIAGLGGTAIGGPLITTDGSSWITTQAHDAAVSPPGTVFTRMVNPALPGSGTVIATDGTSDGSIQYQWGRSALSLSIAGQRNSIRSAVDASFVKADFALSFIPQYSLHYELTGVGDLAPGEVSSIEFAGPNGDLFQVGGGQFSSGGTIFASGDSFALWGDYKTYAGSAPGPSSAFAHSISLKLSLLGDLNGDGSVGFDDLVTLARHYGMPADYAGGDIDGSGVVGFDDLLLLARDYGLSANIGAAVVVLPEPLTVGLLLSSLALGRRRAPSKI